MKTDTLPSLTSGSPKQIAWAARLRTDILREASALEDKFLAAAIPSLLSRIRDATIWIALSDYKRPGPLISRILRVKSPQLARLQRVIVRNLQQHEKLAYMPASAPCLQQTSA